MPKVQKIEDKFGFALPLRLTQRKKTERRSASFRIGCGCCTEGLVIFPPSDADDPQTEINGVMGTIDQWQQIFAPVLRMTPVRTEPLYEFELDATRTYVTLPEAARLADTSFAQVAKITGSVLDPDMKVRPITDEESTRYERMADDWAAER